MNLILPRERVTFDGPNLIVCEGYADVSFMTCLLTSRRVGGFEIGCPTQAQEDVGTEGRSGIGDYLKAVRVQMGRAKNGLKSIAVVIDSDENPQLALADAKRWLRDAGLPVPEEPFRWTADGAALRAVVVLIPGTSLDGSLRKGTLENLLWDVFKDREPALSRCVDHFAACLGGHGDWSSNKRAKMRVHATIAGRCREDPASSLSRIWSKDSRIFPLDHVSFNFIENIFRQVARQ